MFSHRSLWINLIVFISLVIYSESSQYGVTYLFPENRNCTKYENAILREGAKLAWSIAGHNDNYLKFTLNEFDEEIPYVHIVDYNLECSGV